MTVDRRATAASPDRPVLTESDLQLLWSRQLYLPPKMRTEDSRPLAVEFPGVPSIAGPDFRGARIVLDGERVVGDVELHLVPSGWELHRHASNVEFSNVVLHVALRRDRDPRPPASSYAGRPIPELVLEPFLQESAVGIARALRETYPTRAALPADEVGRLLDAEGDARLRDKAAHVDRLLKALPPEEVLYREIMGALGFRPNRSQFEELAALAPVRRLRGRGAAEIFAALRWTAGFDDTRPAWWDGADRMDASLWRRRGARPANDPERRLEAAAALLGSAGADGPLDTLTRLVLNASSLSPEEAGRELARTIERWGRPALGTPRAGEIVHNVVVPFFLALFRGSQAYELAAFMRDIWWFSPAPPDNSRTAFVKQRVFGDPDGGRAIVTNIRRHQGLLGWFARMFG
jgi:hypothetical protein